MALYGAATEMGWRDRVTPRWVLSGVVTSSLAPELSTGMHIAGGMRAGISSARPIPAPFCCRKGEDPTSKGSPRWTSSLQIYTYFQANCPSKGSTPPSRA